MRWRPDRPTLTLRRRGLPPPSGWPLRWKDWPSLPVLGLLVVSVIVLGSAPRAAGADGGARLIVGALEHHHVQWPDWGPSSFPELEKAYRFQVRVLFEKQGSSWVAFPHSPSTLDALHASPQDFPKYFGS